MSSKLFVLAISGLLSSFIVFGSVPDSNIVISNASEIYSFEQDRVTNQVVVKQHLTTAYRGSHCADHVPIAEFYDDETSVDDVIISINNKTTKKIKPAYDYYSVDDIFYSDAHICHFTLPIDCDKGVGETSFKKTTKNPRYFTSVFFRSPYLVEFKTVTFIIPRWMKVNLKELNFEGFHISKGSRFDASLAADVITYTIEKLAPRAKEVNSPGPTYVEPHIMVLSRFADLPSGRQSYFDNLDDQYAWYRTLTKDIESNTAVIKTKALEITAGITNEIDKIKKIYNWTQDNIRYIAFENGIAGFKPDQPEEVLRKKYGDCKGMACLTKALLTSLGFDARLCWIGTNHIAYDYSTPSIAVDNHMICALLLHGKTYFLDATENYIGFGEYAERIQGRQVLIEDGEKYIHTNVPSTFYTQNVDAEKSILTVNGTDLQGTITREWTGEEKENIFAHLNAIKKENSIQAFINYLRYDDNNNLITDFITSDLTNYDEPLRVNYRIQKMNAATSFDSQLYISIDSRKDLDGFTFDINKRKEDYWLEYKINTMSEIQLEIPQGYIMSSIPENLSIKRENYEFSITVSQIPGKIIYLKKIIIRNPIIKRNSFVQWNEDIKRLSAFYNEQIAFKKK